MCQILKRANSKVFIDTFLKTFYDGKIINVKNRLFVPFRLYKQGLLPLDEFTNEFISFLKKASDSNYHYLSFYLLIIYHYIN